MREFAATVRETARRLDVRRDLVSITPLGAMSSIDQNNNAVEIWHTLKAEG